MKDKIPTPSEVSGKSNASDYWYGSTIKNILQNQNYTGDLVQSKETTNSVTSKARKEVAADQYVIVENTHEAIIGEELFNEVQHRLTKRRKVISGPNTHLFSNLLVCDECW